MGAVEHHMKAIKRVFLGKGILQKNDVAAFGVVYSFGLTHFLGNRPRSHGVVEKCTWCIQRSRRGRYPACVEACPVGARKFGNLLDPNGEMRHLLEHKRTFVLKADLNMRPKFFYFYG